MNYLTHCAGGVVTGLLLTDAFGEALSPETIIIANAFAVVGSLLPDIDHGQSYLGRKFGFFAAFLTHRGFTHSILFVVITAIASYLLGLGPIYTTYFVMGIVSHILLDLVSNGVQLLYPLKIKGERKMITLARIKTGSLGETVVFILLALASLKLLGLDVAKVKDLF